MSICCVHHLLAGGLRPLSSVDTAGGRHSARGAPWGSSPAPADSARPPPPLAPNTCPHLLLFLKPPALVSWGSCCAIPATHPGAYDHRSSFSHGSGVSRLEIKLSSGSPLKVPNQGVGRVGPPWGLRGGNQPELLPHLRGVARYPSRSLCGRHTTPISVSVIILLRLRGWPPLSVRTPVQGG